jgi:hypothetical protein
MVYPEINGKALKSCTFNDLHPFFVDLLFFGFMEKGRDGLAAAISDMVDTMSTFVLTQPFGNGTGLTPTQSCALVNSSKKRVTTLFIHPARHEGHR